jgi:hypothetical protein
MCCKGSKTQNYVSVKLYDFEGKTCEGVRKKEYFVGYLTRK